MKTAPSLHHRGRSRQNGVTASSVTPLSVYAHTLQAGGDTSTNASDQAAPVGTAVCLAIVSGESLFPPDMQFWLQRGADTAINCQLMKGGSRSLRLLARGRAPKPGLESRLTAPSPTHRGTAERATGGWSGRANPTTRQVRRQESLTIGTDQDDERKRRSKSTPVRSDASDVDDRQRNCERERVHKHPTGADEMKFVR